MKIRNNRRLSNVVEYGEQYFTKKRKRNCCLNKDKNKKIALRRMKKI